MRRRIRGLMLVTSLFAVLCLYAICAVIFASSQQDLHMQVFSEHQTQADFLAQAALNRCLREANETPGWTATHSVPPGTPLWPVPTAQAMQVVVDPSAPASGFCWLEQTSDPTRLIARGVCETGGSRSVSSAHCLKRPKTEGLLFMLQENPGHLPQAYQYSQSSNLWTALPPTPSLIWRQPGLGGPTPDVLRNALPPGAGKPKFSSETHFPAADEDGNYYQAAYYAPAEVAAIPDCMRIDFLMRLPQGASNWEMLPAVPLGCYVNQASGPPLLTATTPTDPDRRLYLCAANKNRVVAGQRSSASGIVTLYALNNPKLQGVGYNLSGDTFTPLAGSAGWNSLAYCPEADWLSGTLSVQADKAATDLRNLTMDRRGNLYGRLDKPSGQQDVLVYCSNTTGQWSFLPTPPAFAYELDGSDRWVLKDIGSPPDRFADTAVDPDGNFYCVWRRSGVSVDSVFKFCPDGTSPAAGGMLAGSWKVLPSAPRSHYKLDGTLVQNPGATCPQFEAMTVDANGCMYMKSSPFISFLGLALDHVTYSWDCSTGGEKIDQILPAVPQQVTDPNYSALPYFQQTSSGLLSAGSKQIAGGGLQSASAIRVVPVSFFQQ